MYKSKDNENISNTMQDRFKIKNLRQAKRAVRRGMTPDEAYNRGIRGEDYDKLIKSRAYQKQKARQEGTSIRKSKKNYVEEFNKQNEAAGNTDRKKVTLFGKVKSTSSAEMNLDRAEMNLDRAKMEMSRAEMEMERPEMNLDRSEMNMERADMNMERPDMNMDRKMEQKRSEISGIYLDRVNGRLPNDRVGMYYDRMKK